MTDRIDVTVIVDNYIDIFLPRTTVASYPSPANESRFLAEKGLSLWVEASTVRRVTRLLCDFGRSDNVFLQHAHILGLDITRLDHLAQFDVTYIGSPSLHRISRPKGLYKRIRGVLAPQSAGLTVTLKS